MIFLIIGLLALSSATQLTNGPSDGTVLTIGVPYVIGWGSTGGKPTDGIIISILRCPSSSVSAQYCTEALQIKGLTNTGSYAWNATAAFNDGAFYRLQVYDVAGEDVATSGVFVFNPFPVPVDTRCALPVLRRVCPTLLRSISLFLLNWVLSRTGGPVAKATLIILSRTGFRELVPLPQPNCRLSCCILS